MKEKDLIIFRKINDTMLADCNNTYSWLKLRDKKLASEFWKKFTGAEKIIDERLAKKEEIQTWKMSYEFNKDEKLNVKEVRDEKLGWIEKFKNWL